MKKSSTVTSVQSTENPLKNSVDSKALTTTTPDKKRPETKIDSVEKRRPLTPIQEKGRGPLGHEMVGRQKNKSVDPTSSSSKEKPTTRKVSSGFIAKRKLIDKSIQTDEDNGAAADIVTSDEPTLEYWKLLAEERRVALEETLQENQMLTEKVEELEMENNRLNELVEDAKNLAEMINNISEDQDESGIGKDEDEDESLVLQSN